jgi:serpin B
VETIVMLKLNLNWVLNCGLVLLAAATPLAARGAAEDGSSVKATPAATATNQFALDLYARLAPAEKGNLFLSPYSIETALALTYDGARGRTAEQMAAVLRLAGMPPEQVRAAFPTLMEALNRRGTLRGEEKAFELVVANALWAQKAFDLNPKFLDLARKGYGAELQGLDFAGDTEGARRTINAWVEKQTKDKIKDLLPSGSLTPLTRLVLTNAIYFKSAWEEKFSPEMTKDEPFHLDASAATATVPMMHQKHALRYAEDDEAQVVEMPYQSRRLSMLVVLPRKVDGLAALEASLNGQKLDAWVAALQTRDVELSLPKFKYSSHFSLSTALRAMGMTDAFDQAAADLSGIAATSSGTGLLYIQDVVHQAFVDVNEEGTEAAAATGVIMGLRSVRPPAEKAVFKADHPFLFAIRDNQSGTILFFGRVTNPKA